MARLLLPLAALAVILFLLFGGRAREDAPSHESSRGPDVARSDVPSPRLVGRAQDAPPTSPADASGTAGVFTAVEVDPTAVRTRAVRVRVEGTCEGDGPLEILVLDVWGQAVATTTASPETELSSGPLPWGEYVVLARCGSKMGWAPAAWSDVTAVRLEEARRIRGIVHRHGGAPVEGARIGLHAEWGLSWSDTPPRTDHALATVSDAEGRFELAVPPRGDEQPTWLACRHAVLGGTFVPVSPATGTTDVAIALGPAEATVVALHVVDEEGRDVVPLLRWSEQRELALPVTPDAARFEVAWPAGRSSPSLVLTREGHETVVLPGPLDASRVHRIVMRRTPWVQVHARDAQGRDVPSAEVVLLAVEDDEVAWLHGARTDERGVARVPRASDARLLRVASHGLATAIVPIDEHAGVVEVPLAEDPLPVVVLPPDLPHEGQVTVSLTSPDGVLTWEGAFTLHDRETPLPGLPAGRKILEADLLGGRHRPTLVFDRESRLLIPVPEGWIGVAEVEVTIVGAGDLEGLVLEVRESGAAGRVAASPRIENGVARFVVPRGHAFESSVPLLGSALVLPFAVEEDEASVHLEWPLPDEAPPVKRWSPQVRDEATGDALGGGTIELYDVDSFGNAGNRRTSRIEDGRAVVHLLLDRPQKARIVVPGFAPAWHGPMPGAQLLQVERIDLSRPLTLTIVCPSEAPVRVFAVDARSLEHPTALNLSPVGKSRDGVREVAGSRATTHVVWATGTSWARPRRLPAGTPRVELDLRAPAGVVIDLGDADVDASDVRAWIEYPEAGVGFSTLGQWRPLPYPAAAGSRAVVHDGRWTASIAPCPAGSCTLTVVRGDTVVLRRDVVLPEGEILGIELE